MPKTVPFIAVVRLATCPTAAAAAPASDPAAAGDGIPLHHGIKPPATPLKWTRSAEVELEPELEPAAVPSTPAGFERLALELAALSPVCVRDDHAAQKQAAWSKTMMCRLGGKKRPTVAWGQQYDRLHEARRVLRGGSLRVIVLCHCPCQILQPGVWVSSQASHCPDCEILLEQRALALRVHTAANMDYPPTGPSHLCPDCEG